MKVANASADNGRIDPLDAKAARGVRALLGIRLVALAAVCSLARPMSAQFTWNGGSAINSNFSSGGAGGNWSGSAAPTSGTGTLLTFGGSTRLTPNVDQVGFTYGSITFNNTAGAFTIGGNAFTLNGVTNAITNNSANLETINNNLTLGQAQTWNGASGALAFGGTVTNGGFLLTLNGANNITVSNVISGSGGLTVNTSGGTTLLSGNNTFTGTTTLTAGTLRATTSANALGTGVSTLALNGGTLQLADNTGLNFARNTTVGGTTTITSDRTSAGAGTTQTLGTLSIGTNQLNVTAGSNVTSGTAGITFGTTTLTGNSTFGVGTGAQLTLGALNEGGSARTITKTDVGTLILGTNASSVTAGSSLVVNGGIAQVNTATALGTGAFNVTVNATTASGSAAFNLNSVNTTIGSLTFGGAGAGASATNSVATGTGTLTLGGNLAYDATNNPGNASITGKLALGASRVFTIGDSSNSTAELSISAIISGVGFGIDKQGAGTLILSNAANTYTGVTTITGGTLSVGTLANGGSNSSIGKSTNVATNLILNGGTLQYTGGATSTDRLFSVGTGGGAIDASGSGLLTFSNTGALAFNGQTGTRTLTVTGTNNGSLAAVLGDNSGASSLTKSGSGTWTLASAANTYTGVTTVTGGTLSVGTLASGGANSSIGKSTSAAGNLILNGGALQYTGGAVSTDRLFSVGSSGGTLDASGSGALTMTNTGSLGFNGQTGARTLTLTGSNSGTLTAVLGDNSGASSLTKTGSGGWTLAGANTYTGITTVSTGTLTVNSGAAIGGSTSSLVVNGGTLNLNNTAQTVASFSGTGGTVNLGSGHTLTVNDTVTEGYSGVVASSGNLVKNGTGTFTLSGNNTFSGTTTVNGGTLVAGSNTALGAATGAVTVNSGATLAMAAGVNDTKSAGLSIAGTGASGQNGALVASGATGTTGQYSGNITLTGNTTFGAANNLLIVGEGTTFTNTINLGSYNLTLNTTAAVDGSTPTPTYVPYPSYILDQAQIMINSNISGTGGLIKTGPGTVILIPANSTGNPYTGDTVITGGKLIVDPYDGIPAIGSNNVYVGNASSPGAANTVILQMGQLTSPPSVNNSIGVWSGGPSGTDSSSTNLTIYSDGVLNMNNGSNGFKSLTLTGGHVNGQGSTPLLTLGDGGVTSNVLTTNASSQTAVIEGGRLGLASPTNSNFTVAAGSAPGGVDLRIDDIVQQGIQYTAYTDTNTSLTKLGAGKMVLTGANTYHGVTDVSAGILNIQNNVGLGAVSASLGSLDNGTIVRAGAQLQLDKGAGSDLTIGRETLTLNGTGLSSDGALRNVAGNNTYNGYIYLGSDSRINADSGTTLTIANTGGVNASIMNGATAGQNLTVGGVGNTTVNGGISSNVNNITKDGTGTLTLAGYNGYAGATNVTQGAVKVTHSNGLSGTGVTVTSGAALQFAQDATPANISVIAVGTTLNGTGVSNGGAIENLNGSNSYAGTVSLASASSIKADSGSTLTLTGGINNTVPASHQALTVGGAGNITENGAITTGTVTTSGGKITGTGSGGTLTKVDSGTLTIGGGATSALDGITLTLGNITVSGTNTLVQSGPLSSSNAANVLTINSTNTVQSYYGSGTTTFTGVMAGGGTFEKDGAGTLAFNTSFDAQAAGLSLIISGGTVALNAGIQIKVGTIHITGNTILDFGGATSTVLQSTNLIIDPGVSVTVNNWASETDFWIATTSFYQGTTNIAAVRNATGAVPENQITFQGFNAAMTTWIQTPSPHGNYTNNEIRPVPEPSTYGAIFISGALALIGWRRFRRRANAASK